MTDSVSEIAARLRAGLESGDMLTEFVTHTDLRAILDENERLDQSLDITNTLVAALEASLEAEKSRISQLEQQLREARMYLERLCECGIVMIAEHRNAARAFLNKDTPHD